LSGYVGPYASMQPIDEFKVAVRAFMGFGIAERIFKPHYYHFFGDRKSSAVIFLRQEGEWHALQPHKFETGTANLIHSIGPDKLIADKDEDSAKHFAKDFLIRARAAFSDSIARDRLLGSAQWLFDSYTGANELLSFVQAMVAVEILFGDKATSDLLGIGELLANRCAYSIARNRSQREAILRDFKRIYDTRSKIVHRGLSRLSRREQADLSTLRWMLIRSIQEEVKLSMESDDR